MACDLAASGRGEYLDEVRKEWTRREDAAALRAFRACGQLGDIPELEWSIAAGAPREPTRETIEVIRRKYGLGDDGDVPGEGH